tara:strand:+ start:288 stop:518 length:231 start_codon:yes stop_codon:yes gene_type:complete
MSLTELFIRRPVMTVLLNIALIAVGLTALGKIPVAALPRYDTPTINVSAGSTAPAPRPWRAQLRYRWRSSFPPLRA